MHKVIHDTESGLFWVDLEQDFKAKSGLRVEK